MRKQTIMMDSGAFSVWNSGAEVDLDQYIAFCHDHLDIIDSIVALDVIPGQRGHKRSPTLTEREEACEQGWKNYLYMLEKGLPKARVVPVFHQYDDFKWLKEMMDYGVPYIGLSPSKKGVGRRAHQEWFDRCMSYITDEEGRAKVKTHGFGMTSMTMMMRYPWFSVDSTTCLKESMYGTVSVPWRRNGEWDFLSTPRRISVSTRSGDTKVRGAHYSTLPKKGQELIKKYLDEAGVKLGKCEYFKKPLDYKRDVMSEIVFKKNEDHLIIEKVLERGIMNSHRQRCKLNFHYYNMVEDKVEGVERVFKTTTTSGTRLIPHPPRTDGKKMPKMTHLEINTAGSGGYSVNGDVADIPNARHVLFSYHYISGFQKDEFQTIIDKRRGK